MKEKFRKFLPVVVDMETGGFDPVNDALLEIAITLIDYDKEFRVGTTHRHHIIPVDEKEALKDLFSIINKHKNKYECSRAILVGHNAHFDLGFLNESIKRNNIKRSPFHPFSVFDTVSIGGIFTGQTVLARVAKELGFDYENELAHSASYDSEITAKVFCKILNKID